MRSLTSAFLLLAALALSGCERWTLDKQMEELCKKDGGIKIYETVKLPSSEFSDTGTPLFRYHRPGVAEEQRLGPAYKFVSTRTVIAGPSANHEHGEGSLVRLYWGIYRRSDGKLLSEHVEYRRFGGDGFTFGFQPSSASCPRVDRGLEVSTFIKE